MSILNGFGSRNASKKPPKNQPNHFQNPKIHQKMLQKPPNIATKWYKNVQSDPKGGQGTPQGPKESKKDAQRHPKGGQGTPKWTKVAPKTIKNSYQIHHFEMTGSLEPYFSKNEDRFERNTTFLILKSAGVRTPPDPALTPPRTPPLVQ